MQCDAKPRKDLKHRNVWQLVTSRSNRRKCLSRRVRITQNSPRVPQTVLSRAKAMPIPPLTQRVATPRFAFRLIIS